MPKPVVTTTFSCPMHIGRACVVLSALIMLPPAVAAPPEPTLRRSEQLDVRRIGKVSEDERSVLRIEWRVGLTGVDEAHSVQDMLDNLRRIEQSMSAIALLLRNMPVQKPVVAPVAAEPAESGDNGTRLMVANIAAACLVALWWFRRRKPAEPTAKAALQSSPSREAVPDAAASAELQPSPFAQAMQALNAAPRIEPRVAADSVPVAAAPAPSVPPEVKPAPLPPATTSAPSAPPPGAEPAAADFSMDHDPEGEARAHARIPVPRSADKDPRVPERRQELDVEPTLQLAEIMLSMGLEQGAAQALLEYIDAHPKHALYHWLKLLGIYRKRGLQREFNETAEKLRLNFNIQAAEWGPTNAREAPTLESFKRVSEHVQKIWQQPDECIDYLQRLLEDNRDGVRAGFPQSVAEEILLLIEILRDASGGAQTDGT